MSVIEDTSTGSSARRGAVLARRTYWAGFLIGVAVMAAIDEIVFHQILGWHHFYDSATPDAALVSDGILHAGELFVLVAGFFLLADARRRGGFERLSTWAGFFTGAGLFQVWDGTVHHKLLGLHQVRYDVDLVPYDIAWITGGVVLFAVGLALTVAASRRRGRG